ncbi:MAG: acetyl-CoA carboxylase, biotin carboxyl carrier protein [Verrucomicrobia bacterium]|nr:MAG: acetyl-CoA carboxylase, biotin carboxyl carrier protein [Verrucomicrobiota bacterium]
MTLSHNDIKNLVEMFAACGWDELQLEIDGVQLFLSTDPDAGRGPGPLPLPESLPASPVATLEGANNIHGQSVGAQDEVPSNWVAVTAQHLGTFYRSPKPGAPPYVEAGQAVAVEAELCLLEVMKLFTAVKAQTSGVVRRICARDGEMVEYDEVLFYIEPD